MQFTTYKDFLDYLVETKQWFSKTPLYYKTLVRFNTDIQETIAKDGQAATAKQLGISQSKLSTLLLILKAL